MAQLQKILNENNITIETLSIASGVDQNTITDILDGKITINNIKLYDMLMICKALYDIRGTDIDFEFFSELKHAYCIAINLLETDN